MKFLLVSLAFAALSASTHAVADGDIAAGKARASGACLSCHGLDGIGRNERWPNIAGQNDLYLIKQMNDFRKGTRKDSYMTPMARPLTDRNIRDIAAYYASLPADHVSPPGIGDPAAGRKKAAACVECHGADGRSPNREWPNLAGQKPDYLIKQMRKFRDGMRQDPLMSPVAATLSNEDINDLAAWFATLAQ